MTHDCCVDSRRRAAAADKRRALQFQQQLNSGQYGKDDSQAAAYMSMKCDNRSLYPYAVSVGPGARMLPRGLQYDAGDGGGADGDAYSWRSNVDNDYAYVDDLLPPPPLPQPRQQSPPPRDYASAADNNNGHASRAAEQSASDHVTGCLLACRQYDVAPEDRLRVEVCNNWDWTVSRFMMSGQNCPHILKFH